MHPVRNGPVVLITGASSGIGKALADILVHEGYRVYGTSRHKPGAAQLPLVEKGKKSKGGHFEMLTLDVRDEVSINCAINHILAKEAGIDILINNAGYALF